MSLSQQKKAIGYGVLGAMSFAIMANLISKITRDISLSELIAFRGLFGVVLLAPIFFIYPRFKGKISKPVLLRGFFGTLALFVYCEMIQRAGPSIAGSLSATSPVFVFLVAIALRNEKIKLQKIAGILLIGLGVLTPILFAQTSQTTPQILALGLFGAVLTGFSFTFLKLASQRAPELFIYWIFCVMQVLVQVPVTLVAKTPGFQVHLSSFFNVSALELSKLLGISVFALSGQVFMSLSYHYLDASYASALNTLTIPFTLLIDAAIFGRVYTPAEIAMITLIFTGILTMSYRWKKKQLA